ncbi:MAG: adenine phosphoribosyltransferase [Armatimonadetes bacterium]|nr:adenine phosphoribosyltransferase [Armatimonadota bacterium]MDE2205887.1 adenine phosphoribosyltransferase [Armatimonadota bacterium]
MKPLRAASLIRDIPDFPKPGILFKDITPVLADPDAFREVTQAMTAWAAGQRVDAVAAIEARGFLFGGPVALSLDVPLIPVRKPGKLPHSTIAEEYLLEYGSNTVEMHRDAVAAGQRVLVIDDLLATGGTAGAVGSLLRQLGAEVAGYAFFIELMFLNGRQTLAPAEVLSLVKIE